MAYPTDVGHPKVPVWVARLQALPNMRVQRIYVDTSVIGGCHDAEFSEWSNALMKDFRIGIYKPVVSEVVAAEIDDAPEQVRKEYEDLLLCDPEIVPVGKEAMELADAYLRRNVFTPNLGNDMLHIALATIAEVDVLVSWNFRHIVRLDRIRLINAVNLELGYKPLQVYSPREVATHEAQTD